MKSPLPLTPDFMLFCPRLPGEPNDAYEALHSWADLGVEQRNITMLVRTLKERWRDRDALPGLFQIQTWQREFNWETRITTYDHEARQLIEIAKREQWAHDVGEAEQMIARITVRLLQRAHEVAQLPVVEKKVKHDDGTTTVIRPLRVTARDAIAITEASQRILEKTRPRTQGEEIMEALGMYVKGMESGVLSPDQCATVARHLAAMKAELEGGRVMASGD